MHGGDKVLRGQVFLGVRSPACVSGYEGNRIGNYNWGQDGGDLEWQTKELGHC